MTRCENLCLLAGASGSTGETGASGQTGLTGGFRFWVSSDVYSVMVSIIRACEKLLLSVEGQACDTM